MPADNINLMPENLRQDEQSLLAKKNNQPAPNVLSTPMANTAPIADDPSGSSSGDSWLQTILHKNTPEVPVAPTVSETKVPEFIAPPVVAINSMSPAPVREDTSGFKLASQVTSAANGSGFHQPEKIIRARFVEDASGVDLVPQLSKIKSWQQIGSLIVIALVASLGVVVVFWFGLLTWNTHLTSIGQKTTENIQNTENALLEFEDSVKRINDTGQEIQRVYDLLNKHIYWTNFFVLLEKYTLAEVKFSGFAATNGGALTLNATAPDYATMAKQLKILQTEVAQEFVTEVDISGGTKSETGVAFSVALVLNPDLFYYQTNK